MNVGWAAASPIRCVRLTWVVRGYHSGLGVPWWGSELHTPQRRSHVCMLSPRAHTVVCCSWPAQFQATGACITRAVARAGGGTSRCACPGGQAQVFCSAWGVCVWRLLGWDVQPYPSLCVDTQLQLVVAQAQCTLLLQECHSVGAAMRCSNGAQPRGWFCCLVFLLSRCCYVPASWVY
jgi:hypothetical protein